MRILLIDDSSAYREEFAHLLVESKIAFLALDHASTAAEGARLLQLRAHDVYFVDYRLPADDGLSLVAAARGAGNTKPIIVLTAFDSPAIDARAEQAGATDYLAKGEFTAAMLGRAIRYAISNAAALDDAKEAESRLRIAQEAAAIGTWDWDIRSNKITWSRRQYELFGLDPDSPEPIHYDHWRLAIHPDDRDGAQAAVTAALAGQTSFDTLFRVMRPNPADLNAQGQVRWLMGKGEVVRDGQGAPVRMIGVNIDVTDQQRALAALRASRRKAVAERRSSDLRFQTYFDSAADCLFHVVREEDGRYIYQSINPVGLAHAGMTLDAVRGRTPEEVLGPLVGGTIVKALRHVFETGEPYHYEPTLDMSDGPLVYDAIYIPLRGESGDVVGVLGSARDVTEKRTLEATLRQAQKMEALGQLAGGIAHDFNNLMQATLSCFTLLGKHVSSEAGRDLLAEGRRIVERSKGLTERLLAFARQQPLVTESVDLNACVLEMMEMLARTLGGNVRIRRELADDLWPAVGDRNQIDLALLNLAINARDAMEQGGELTIGTGNTTFVQPQPDGLRPGDYVVISVADTGIGMSPHVLARAFEPFFTTKEPGKGTGLGLSMVYGVVGQLGGVVRLESSVGKGTSVTLYLPRAKVERGGAVADMESRLDAEVVPFRRSSGKG